VNGNWQWLLTDELCHGGKYYVAPGKTAHFPDHLALDMRRVPRFEISNVYQMLMARCGNEPPSGNYLELSSLPPLSIPFPKFWLEYEAEINKERFKCSILWMVAESEGKLLLEGIMFGKLIPAPPPDGMVASSLPHLPTLVSNLRISLNPEDRRPVSVFERIHSIDAPENPEWKKSANFAAAPSLYALALMGCKNSSLAAVTPSRQQLRYAQRVNGVALVSYNVVTIKSKRNPPHSGSGRPVAHRGTAMHICRGHFKTYDNGKLFGNRAGTWWWADHARGDGSNGVIVKDYRMDAAGSSAIQ
jgi:hypothetical protein